MNKKAIITSALPYSNGEIHLGHVASTYLPADVTTRFLKQNGVEAYYICASDDYGTPILIQSEKLKQTPQEYVAHWNKRDYEDFTAFDIGFDFFYKTSSEENISFVQDVFKKIEKNGHIYEKEIIQAFCTSCDKFLPDRFVKGTCPFCNAEDQYSDLCEKCGRIPEEIENPHCSICGETPVQKSTNHYFFKLKNFSEPLLEYLENAPYLQKDVKKYVENWIKEGLVDWDITRDIPWGVPIPIDGLKDKVFYGWFDNHLAYISSTLKFLNDKNIDGKSFWNDADIYHFIGKDIVYHHYLFLPAMRLGIEKEFKLPDYIPTRGHLTLEGKKISKSRNWYIGLKDFLEKFPADYLRFYLISINPYSQDDLNFDWEQFSTKINSELIGNLGNLVNRALGFTNKTFDGVVPEPEKFDEKDSESEQKIKSLAEDIGKLMEENHLDRALKQLMEFSAHFNQYFQHKEPWKKGPGTNACIYLSVNAVRSIAICLQSFLPKSSQKIWSQLGLDGNVSDVNWNEMSNLELKSGHKIGATEPIFSKIEQSVIDEEQSKLGN
ncbi:methionine--tRNA ligase [Candidatus Nitrosopelagicus brevis]|uniref:Methionine--tRNA ligase n=1 Tax=Candidatus Nitrosopelagicus brevis TaxID=1410606 RepID=A0A0A7V019_9ARCH|nr:methionine--tRNA ligase [Candidatus Nitrosopelagicus brevis]AJA92392.1 methionine--tRNA ligase [Candidatus Nitrosopelagicus brevis]PTL88059.1 methionine--tRNA ligase [Candidatus Nitrosopelagicus brevis]